MFFFGFGFFSVFVFFVFFFVFWVLGCLPLFFGFDLSSLIAVCCFGFRERSKTAKTPGTVFGLKPANQSTATIGSAWVSARRGTRHHDNNLWQRTWKGYEEMR